MNRRQALLAASALAAAPLIYAQAGRVARVGMLASGRAPSAEEWARSPFRIKLSELGWVEGRNLKIERRHATSAAELTQAARDLAALKLDAVYAAGAPSLSSCASSRSQALRRSSPPSPIFSARGSKGSPTSRIR